MKAILLAILTVTMMLLMQITVSAPHWIEEKVAWVYARDLVMLTMVVVLLARTKLSKSAVWVATFAGWFVMIYEWVRAVGLEAMGQEPLLYDALFLGKHLYILLRDLLGDQATMMLYGLIATLVVSFVVYRLFFGWMAACARKGGWLHLVVVALLMAGAVRMVESEEYSVTGMDTLADARDNVKRSEGVWSSLKKGLDDQLYKDIDKLKLKNKPRVHIYIIESYGRASLRPTIRKRYRAYLTEIGELSSVMPLLRSTSYVAIVVPPLNARTSSEESSGCQATELLRPLLLLPTK